jgi:hypothetical protein
MIQVTGKSVAAELDKLNAALLLFAQAHKVRNALDVAMFKCWIHREHMRKDMKEYRSYSLVAGMIVMPASWT